MITELNLFDRALQTVFPTIMVPKKSELAPCKEGQTRLLMASDGLYIETRCAFGGLVRKLWDCPRQLPPLPYGSIEERDDFLPVLHDYVMPLFKEHMIEEAAAYAERKKEWAGFVVWDGAAFLPVKLAYTSTSVTVDFLDCLQRELAPGHSIVADIHSHHVMEPRFSQLDDISDRGRVKISVVVGNYRSAEGRPLFDWTARYCVEGFFFVNGPSADIFSVDEEDCHAES
ncbi:MAG: DUF2016 domain-containing protein [Thermodesulfovibrionales bacterium]